MRNLILSLTILFASTVGSTAEDNKPPVQLPGHQSDGSVLLPNQWSLRPVGRQIELGDFPINIAVHPQGRFAAILHSGYSQHGIMVVDLVTEKVVTNAPLEEAFYGITFSHDGTRLFCSGASEEVIHSFHFKDGLLSDQHDIRLRDIKAVGHSRGTGLECLGEQALCGKSVWPERFRSRLAEGKGHRYPVDASGIRI
jgi:hypothetical protein